jgi:hypothetical protein
MKARINVTQDHIDKGDPGNCMGCPIFLALVDCGYRYVVVTDRHVRLDGAVAVLPDEAVEFVNKFDFSCQSDPVEPFSFDLELP